VHFNDERLRSGIRLNFASNSKNQFDCASLPMFHREYLGLEVT
jgi:hypothetical protein